MPDALLIVGGDGRIRYVDGGVVNLFGYSRSELMGQPVEVIVPDGLSRGAVPHIPYDTTGRWSSYAETATGLRLSGRRKDGSELPVEVTLSELRTAEGVLIAGAIREAAGQTGVAEEVRRARLAAERATKALETFRTSVVRDLSELLISINELSQGLLDRNGEQLDADGIRRLHLLRTSAQQLSGVVEGLRRT